MSDNRSYLQCQEKGCRNSGNVWIIKGKKRKWNMIQSDIGFCTSIHLENWIHRYNNGEFLKENGIKPKTMRQSK